MGLDFGALATKAIIRDRLDQLTVPHLRGGQEAKEAILAAVEELEQRLDTARRTAWVAVPIAWQEVTPGDVIDGKDGLLVVSEVATEPDPELPGGRVGRIRVPTGWLTTRRPEAKRVPVLRRPTADALDILARQLGAQVTK